MTKYTTSISSLVLVLKREKIIIRHPPSWVFRLLLKYTTIYHTSLILFNSYISHPPFVYIIYLFIRTVLLDFSFFFFFWFLLLLNPLLLKDLSFIIYVSGTSSLLTPLILFVFWSRWTHTTDFVCCHHTLNPS